MRCFVATWPGQTARVALQALSDHLRGQVAHRRATDSDNLHLTLAFIGTLSDAVAASVAEAIAQLDLKSFQWRIDRLGFFRQAGVVWAGADSASNAALIALAGRVRHTLDALHVDYDRKPFAPHVTLLRGVARFTAVSLDTPIDWRIDNVALYRSSGGRAGSKYSRVLD
jgi:2'-5' RNA ligase